MYMNHSSETVYNEYGLPINYETAVELMDDDLREELHRMVDETWTDQTFFDRYAAAHLEKFGEEWELAKPNPTF